MAGLELNIDDLLAYRLGEGSAVPGMLEKTMPHGKEEEKTPTVCVSEILSPLTSEQNLKKISPDDAEKYQSSRIGLAFLVVRDYLPPYSTMQLKDVVSRIVDVWPDDCVDMRDLNELWFELGQQIPYYHPWQIKLAKVVQGVGEVRNEFKNMRPK